MAQRPLGHACYNPGNNALYISWSVRQYQDVTEAQASVGIGILEGFLAENPDCSVAGGLCIGLVAAGRTGRIEVDRETGVIPLHRRLASGDRVGNIGEQFEVEFRTKGLVDPPDLLKSQQLGGALADVGEHAEAVNRPGRSREPCHRPNVVLAGFPQTDQAVVFNRPEQGETIWKHSAEKILVEIEQPAILEKWRQQGLVTGISRQNKFQIAPSAGGGGHVVVVNLGADRFTMGVTAFHRGLVPKDRKRSAIMVSSNKINVSIQLEVASTDKSRGIAGIVGNSRIEGPISPVDQH